MRRLAVLAAVAAGAGAAAVVAALVAAAVGTGGVTGPPAPASPESEASGEPPAAGPGQSEPEAVDRSADDAADERLRGDLRGLAAGDVPSSCLVVAHGGREVFSHHPALPLVPASATKLLTAVAALRTGTGGPDEIARMLRDSDNAVARRLLGEMGPAGILAAIAEAGIPTGGVEVVDGAGLDRRNRATCAALHATVTTAAGADAVTGSLAVAGRDGTLRDRFVGTALEGRLRAKTGSLRGVVALVGVLDAPGGERLTFAYLLNGVVSGDAGVARQDELAAALARFVSGTAR